MKRRFNKGAFDPICAVPHSGGTETRRANGIVKIVTLRGILFSVEQYRKLHARKKKYLKFTFLFCKQAGYA